MSFCRSVALSLCRCVAQSLLLVYVCTINKTCQLVIAVPRRCLRARVVLGLQLVIVMAIEIGRNKSVYRDRGRWRGGGGEEYIVYWLYWHCLCYWTIYICCWGSLLIYDCWRKSGLKAGGKLLFINKYATHKSLCWAINKPHRTRLKQAGATNVIKCVSSQEERERKESESESELQSFVPRCQLRVLATLWHFGACLLCCCTSDTY